MINQVLSLLREWLAQVDSNHRPRAYQARALTTWAMRHYGYLLRFPHVPLVEMMGIEPMTPCLQGRCSPSWATPPSGLGIIIFFSVNRLLKIEQQVNLCFLSTALSLSSSFLFFGLFFCLFANTRYLWVISHILHRKEVIQPHLPIRLPCYDLTPINKPTFDCCPLAVSPQASGVFIFHGLTGGVYKARERIHRGMLIRDY